MTAEQCSARYGIEMMKFNTAFKGGPAANQMAVVVCKEFQVGMMFEAKGGKYQVLPGPAAKYCEVNQKCCDSLCVLSEFVNTAEQVLGVKGE